MWIGWLEFHLKFDYQIKRKVTNKKENLKIDVCDHTWENMLMKKQRQISDVWCVCNFVRVIIDQKKMKLDM